MIFYLSSTGNTRWAAKKVAQAMGEELLYMPEIANSEPSVTLKAGETLGFMFPVHGWRPPLFVRKLVRKLAIAVPKDTYIYVLMTAGDSIGRTTEIFKADLKRKGLWLNAAFSLILPDSYVGLPFMDVDSKEEEIQKKTNAAQLLDEYIEDIKLRKSVINTIKGPIPWFFSGPVGSFFTEHLITDEPFHVDSVKCVKCGICADVCPVQDIKGGLGYEPEWRHTGECMSCFACYHHCPHHAIEYGKRTKNKGQYFFDKRKIK